MPTTNSTPPSVAAIVLNYNGKDITLEAIESLSQMTYENFSILHIDNGSTDGSFEAVGTAFPDVINLRVEENRGAARGLNFGMRAGYERGFDYLMIMNNDIGVESSMLSEMMAVATSDPSIGAVQPKMYYYWDRERLWFLALQRYLVVYGCTQERAADLVLEIYDDMVWDRQAREDYVLPETAETLQILQAEH